MYELSIEATFRDFVQEVSGVFQLGIFSFTYERKSEEKTKTAKQIDG